MHRSVLRETGGAIAVLQVGPFITWRITERVMTILLASGY